MNRVRTFALLALLALLAGPDGAAARHAERSAVVNRTVSARVPPDGLWLVGLDGVLASIDLSDDQWIETVETRSFGLVLEGGPLSWLRLRARAPFHTWSGAPASTGIPASGSGLGDASVAAAASLPSPWSFLSAALDVRRTLPTGDEALGTGAGEGTGYLGTALTLRAWTDHAAPEMRLHVNAGRLSHPDAAYGGIDGTRVMTWDRQWPAAVDGMDNDPLVLGAALEFRKGSVALAVEHVRHVYDDGLVADGERPAWWTTALHWGAETGPGLTLAWDVPTAVDDPDTPYRALPADHVIRAGVAWSLAAGGRDRDGDGLKDRLDPCPDDAEDYDGFQDDDGCPDPDNDEDGIPDHLDQAPLLPEDYDGWHDDDGLPEPDNDNDGILDGDDECPCEAEDFDGHQDEDGCPEEFVDTDGDGIPDEDDVCPLEPEDIDGFMDDDGCPDPDNDLDGIPDELDACPDEAEDYDGVDDDDGCPE